MPLCVAARARARRRAGSNLCKTKEVVVMEEGSNGEDRD